MFLHESRFNRDPLFLVCALALGATGCAKAAVAPTEIISPSNEHDAGDEPEADAGGDMPVMRDSGTTPMPQGDAGAKDAGSTDSGMAVDPPCNIAVSETFDNDELLDREDASKAWAQENVGTSFTWQWLDGAGAIPNKTLSASKAGYWLVNSYDKKTPFDARLVSPSLAIGNCKTVSLAFDQYLSVQASDIKGSVQVRVTGGAWENVQTFSTDISKVAQHEDIDLTSFVIGKGKTFQLAFRYEDPRGLGVYWQIDDVKINAVAK